MEISGHKEPEERNKTTLTASLFILLLSTDPMSTTTKLQGALITIIIIFEDNESMVWYSLFWAVFELFSAWTVFIQETSSVCSLFKTLELLGPKRRKYYSALVKKNHNDICNYPLLRRRRKGCLNWDFHRVITAGRRNVQIEEIFSHGGPNWLISVSRKSSDELAHRVAMLLSDNENCCHNRAFSRLILPRGAQIWALRAQSSQFRVA